MAQQNAKRSKEHRVVVAAPTNWFDTEFMKVRLTKWSQWAGKRERGWVSEAKCYVQNLSPNYW